MTIKIIAIVVVALSCFHYGCASDNGLDRALSSSGSVLSIDIDPKAKLDYLQNVKNSLKLYNQIVLDLKYYHDRYNFRELAGEIDRYVKTYINDILLDSESNSSIDIKMEIAKIQLLVTSLYLDIGYNIKGLKFLELFHDRYHNDRHLLEKTLNPDDIGYSSLGQGMRILEERVRREVVPVIHGKIYPWQKAHGKNYPWRRPKM